MKTELHKALEVPGHYDLRGFSELLWQRHVPHRISENGSAQIVWVADPELIEKVNTLFKAVDDGDLELPALLNRKPAQRPAVAWHAWREYPVTLILILLSVAGAILVALDPSLKWVSHLTFYQYQLAGDQLRVGLPPAGESWRILTPIFLHFGLLHICFNALWMWELGRRVEIQQGGWRLMGITVLVGMGSNLAQAMTTGVALFGGLSGVIYGLLGYAVVWGKLRPFEDFGIPKAVVIFMLVWLFASYLGLGRLLSGNDTANAAHLGGLIMGILLAITAGGLDNVRRIGPSDSES